MPTYEYECRKCGHHFDHSQPIIAKPLTHCPKCKGKIRRVISGGSGFLFKGSGFYATDYRSSSYKEKAGKEKPNTTSAKGSEKPSCPSKS